MTHWESPKWAIPQYRVKSSSSKIKWFINKKGVKKKLSSFEVDDNWWLLSSPRSWHDLFASKTTSRVFHFLYHFVFRTCRYCFSYRYFCPCSCHWSIASPSAPVTAIVMTPEASWSVAVPVTWKSLGADRWKTTDSRFPPGAISFSPSNVSPSLIHQRSSLSSGSLLPFPLSPCHSLFCDFFINNTEQRFSNYLWGEGPFFISKPDVN